MFEIGILESFGALIAMTIYSISKNKAKRGVVLELIKEPLFIINLVAITAFSIYMLNTTDTSEESERQRQATKLAIVGLLIAVMAHVGMKIAPFWLIWVTSYYLKT
jgi:uncharacterized membrane protein